MRLRSRVDAMDRMERLHLREKVRELTHSLACPSGRAWPTSTLTSAAFSAAGLAMRAGLHAIRSLRHIGLEAGIATNGRTEDEWLNDTLANFGWPSRPPHIALLDAGDWSVNLVRTSGVMWPQWFVLSRGDTMPTVHDATVTCSRHADMQITMRENSGKDAAWFDWAYERPLNFASVFPTRLDCSRVTLTTGEVGYQPLLGIMRLLIDVACVTSRHPARITTRDRIDGRTLSWAMFSETRLTGKTDPLALIMRPLADQLALLDDTARQTGTAKVAARVLAAWACMADEQDAMLRRACAELALTILPDEVETQLRVAAVRLADSDDEAGLELLEQAATTLQHRELVAASDQVQFVLSELYTEPGCPLAIGRAAAGVVLVGARVPKEQLPYFRDDILDEVDHAGSLVGFDQHRAVVLEAFHMLEIVKGLRPTKGPKLRLVGENKKSKPGKKPSAGQSGSTKVAQAGKVARTAKSAASARPSVTSKPTAKTVAKTKLKKARKSPIAGRIEPQTKARKKAA